MNGKYECPVCKEEIETHKIIRAASAILEISLKNHPSTALALGDAQCQSCLGVFHIVMTEIAQNKEGVSFSMKLIDSKTCQALREKLKDIISIGKKQIDISRN